MVSAVRLIAAVWLLAVMATGSRVAACPPALTRLECLTTRLIEQDRVGDAMLTAARAADTAETRGDETDALAARIRFADLLRLHGAAEAARALLEADTPLVTAAPLPLRQDHAAALAIAQAFAGDFDGAATTVAAGLSLSPVLTPGTLRLKAFGARLAHVLGQNATARAAHAALDADMRRTFGGQSVDYAKYLSDQASMESSADQDHRALDMAAQARAIFGALPSKHGANYRFLLNNLVPYLGYVGQEERAVALNRRALPLYERGLARQLADPTSDPAETQRLLQTSVRAALAAMWRLKERTSSPSARRALLADVLATASAAPEGRAALRLVGPVGPSGTAGLMVEERRAAWTALLADVAHGTRPAADEVRRLAAFLRRTRTGRMPLPPAILDRTLLDRIQRRLGPDEALLLIVPATNAGFTIAVTTEGADWWRTPLSVAAACEAVSKLRRSIVSGPPMTCRNARYQAVVTEVEEREPFDPAAAARLYRDLVGGAGPMLAGKRTWHVLTYDSVAALPFGALLLSDPGPGLQPWYKLDWLGSRHAVTLLPALAMLLTGSDAASAPKNRPVVIAVGATCGTAEEAGCPPHPAVAGDLDEKAELARLVAMGAPGSELLTGEAATRRAVLGAASRAHILVFAAHAVLSRDGVALRLGGPGQKADLLDARELVGVRLNDPLVMLGACDTSAISDRSQDEVLRDLSYAFIAAGSRRLLLTHYQVAEGAASYLTDRIVDEMVRADDHPVLAEALRRATAALMHDPSARHLTDPAAWSGFFAAGAPF